MPSRESRGKSRGRKGPKQGSGAESRAKAEHSSQRPSGTKEAAGSRWELNVATLGRRLWPAANATRWLLLG